VGTILLIESALLDFVFKRLNPSSHGFLPRSLRQDGNRRERALMRWSSAWISRCHSRLCSATSHVRDRGEDAFRSANNRHGPPRARLRSDS